MLDWEEIGSEDSKNNTSVKLWWHRTTLLSPVSYESLAT